MPILAAVLSAQALEGTSDGATLLLAYGPLGVFAMLSLIAFRVIYKRFNEFVARESTRADAAEQSLRDLQAKVIDSYVPALTRSTDALTEVLTEIRRDRR